MAGRNNTQKLIREANGKAVGFDKRGRFETFNRKRLKLWLLCARINIGNDNGNGNGGDGSSAMQYGKELVMKRPPIT